MTVGFSADGTSPFPGGGGFSERAWSIHSAVAEEGARMIGGDCPNVLFRVGAGRPRHWSLEAEPPGGGRRSIRLPMNGRRWDGVEEAWAEALAGGCRFDSESGGEKGDGRASGGWFVGGPLLEYAAVEGGWAAADAAERRAAEEAGSPSAHCRAHAFGARAPCFLAKPKDAGAFEEAAEACARLGALLRHREHLFFEGGGAGDSFQERLEKLLRLPAAAGKEAWRLGEGVRAAFPDRMDEAIAVLRHDGCAGVLCSSALGTIGPSPLFWVPIGPDAPYPNGEEHPCSN